jgi:hypothetical protein
MSGIMIGASNLSNIFGGTTVTYNAAGTFTETIPSGATSVVVECWGGGAQGGLFSAFGAGGGGGGAYSRCTVAVGSQNGKTFIVIVGTAGTSTQDQTPFPVQQGGDSHINAGSITGFTAILCSGAFAGGDGSIGNGNGQGGPGGTATNANAGAVRTNGNAGTNNSGNNGGAGATPISGLNAGPFGGGGKGENLNQTPAGVGTAGGAAFRYT